MSGQPRKRPVAKNMNMKRSSRIVVASALQSETDTRAEQRDLTHLMYWHIGAAAVFVVSAIVMLSVYLGLDVDGLQGVLSSTTLVVSNTTQPLQVKQLQSYDLFWLNVAIPLVTACFHVLQAWFVYSRNDVYVRGVFRKRNLVRWIEYLPRLFCQSGNCRARMPRRWESRRAASCRGTAGR